MVRRAEFFFVGDACLVSGRDTVVIVVVEAVFVVNVVVGSVVKGALVEGRTTVYLRLGRTRLTGSKRQDSEMRLEFCFRCVRVAYL